MKLISIVLGQAVRLFKATNPIGGTYLPNVAAAFRERYGFMEVHSKVAEYDATKGITFGHGKFKVRTTESTERRVAEEIVIDSFQVFNDGLVVNTRALVEDADLFLDDVIAWFTGSFGYNILDDPPTQRTYASHVEVTFQGSLVPLFNKIGILNKRITTALTRYGKVPPSYEVSGFSLHCDTTKLLSPIPSAFTFERRAQHSYTSNLYFSSAPLKTSDHLKVLEELEKLASKK